MHFLGKLGLVYTGVSHCLLNLPDDYPLPSKVGTDLSSGSRPPRFPHFNPDTYTTLDRVDELLAASQLIAVDSRCNPFVRFGATFTFNETPVGVGIYRADFVTPFPKRTTAFFKGVQEASLAADQTFHELWNDSHIIVCLNNQMNAIGHQTIAVYLDFMNLLPLPQVRQEILKVTPLDEHGLAIMTALDNVMGKTGHDYPGLSGH
jgi:hypothetical protein